MKQSTQLKLVVWAVVFGIIGISIGMCFGVRKLGGSNGDKLAIGFAIFLLLFMIIGSGCFCNYAKKEIYKVQNPRLHNKLYDLMKYFDNICTKHHIKYWAIGGTLLGSIRHKAIIPNDDDIDLGITHESFTILKNIVDKDSKYKIIGKDGFYKFGRIDDQTNDEHKFNSWIDIMIMKEANDDKYQYTSNFCKTMWPTEWFYSRELFPLKRYKFGKIKIFGAKNPKSYLVRVYGNDWKTPRITHAHRPNFYETLSIFYTNLGLL